MNTANTAKGRTAELSAYGKINLYLDVTGVHSSGKHLLRTVMHTVSLCDRVKVTAVGGGIRLKCHGEFAVPEDGSNIACRCAEAFFAATSARAGIGTDVTRNGGSGSGDIGRDAFGGADIEIEKHIPTGAGLGGGSADGGAVLRGLNMLYGGIFSVSELCAIGAAVGADIPFCIAGGCGYCTGFGEIIEPLPNMNGCIVIAKGDESVSTSEAYGRIDDMLGMRGENVSGGVSAGSGELSGEDICRIFGQGGNVSGTAGACYNIFEEVTENADVARIRTVMGEMGAAGVMMTGSGSAVFGIFEDGEQADEAVKRLKGGGFWCGKYELVDAGKLREEERVKD
ncbi:MAG: 4-(cytidine 5'-diphospho)-2-C-methyl-D-erythritol kinase [Ruminococcus sp.]|nr:4-(cytidine 5'-diphospho)-2-C-methyl-D-erythritol kinase [Ruminococcus sp.]